MIRCSPSLVGRYVTFNCLVSAATIAHVLGQASSVVRGDELLASDRNGVSSATVPHELWLVSCRQGALDDGDPARLVYSVHREVSGWSPASQDDFRGSPAPAAQCVLVLGHGYTAAQTRQLGTTIFRRLTATLPAELPVRFVIWSWPSDKGDIGPIKDLRAKAARTPQVARSLARWLDETPMAGRVSLLGTSFGARVVMEALELRSGGRLGSVQLAGTPSIPRRPVNVVLVTAAIDSDWLFPGRRLGFSVSDVDRLLLINNRDDSMLNRYHWLYGRRSKAVALGVTGLAASRLGEAAGGVQQIDAAPIIGRQHGCAPYFDSPRLLSAMRPVLFGEGPLQQQPTPTPPTRGETIPIARKSGARDGAKR